MRLRLRHLCRITRCRVCYVYPLLYSSSTKANTCSTSQQETSRFPISGWSKYFFLLISMQIICWRACFAATLIRRVQEAIRVKTPPIGEYTADGRPRAFFTSMTPPHLSGSDLSSLSRGSSRHLGHRRSMNPQPRELWEHFPQKPPPQDPSDKATKFEFQVPEHLPSSPMCPTNTNHQTSGTGLCVYHGRKRATSGLKDVANVGEY